MPPSAPPTTDSDAWDLSLVADAMATSERPSAPASALPASDPPVTAPSSSSLDSLSVDLASLTPADRDLLQPLIDALAASAAEGDDDPEAGEDTAELERRLDQAGEVASGLESMLDGLLDRLEGMLEGAGVDLEDGLEDVEEESQEAQGKLDELDGGGAEQANERTAPSISGVGRPASSTSR